MMEATTASTTLDFPLNIFPHAAAPDAAAAAAAVKVAEGHQQNAKKNRMDNDSNEREPELEVVWLSASTPTQRKSYTVTLDNQPGAQDTVYSVDESSNAMSSPVKRREASTTPTTAATGTTVMEPLEDSNDIECMLDESWSHSAMSKNEDEENGNDENQDKNNALPKPDLLPTAETATAPASRLDQAYPDPSLCTHHTVTTSSSPAGESPNNSKDQRQRHQQTSLDVTSIWIPSNKHTNDDQIQQDKDPPCSDPSENLLDIPQQEPRLTPPSKKELGADNNNAWDIIPDESQERFLMYPPPKELFPAQENDDNANALQESLNETSHQDYCVDPERYSSQNNPPLLNQFLWDTMTTTEPVATVAAFPVSSVEMLAGGVTSTENSSQDRDAVLDYYHHLASSVASGSSTCSPCLQQNSQHSGWKDVVAEPLVDTSWLDDGSGDFGINEDAGADGYIDMHSLLMANVLGVEPIPAMVQSETIRLFMDDYTDADYRRVLASLYANQVVRKLVLFRQRSSSGGNSSGSEKYKRRPVGRTQTQVQVLFYLLTNCITTLEELHGWNWTQETLSSWTRELPYHPTLEYIQLHMEGQHTVDEEFCRMIPTLPRLVSLELEVGASFPVSLLVTPPLPCTTAEDEVPTSSLSVLSILCSKPVTDENCQDDGNRTLPVPSSSNNNNNRELPTSFAMDASEIVALGHILKETTTPTSLTVLDIEPCLTGTLAFVALAKALETNQTLDTFQFTTATASPHESKRLLQALWDLLQNNQHLGVLWNHAYESWMTNAEEQQKTLALLEGHPTMRQFHVFAEDANYWYKKTKLLENKAEEE